jgi:hypothetical protein
LLDKSKQGIEIGKGLREFVVEAIGVHDKENIRKIKSRADLRCLRTTVASLDGTRNSRKQWTVVLPVDKLVTVGVGIEWICSVAITTTECGSYSIISTIITGTATRHSLALTRITSAVHCSYGHRF